MKKIQGLEAPHGATSEGVAPPIVVRSVVVKMFQRCSIRCSMATHKGGEGPRQGRGGVVNDGSKLLSTLKIKF